MEEEREGVRESDRDIKHKVNQPLRSHSLSSVLVNLPYLTCLLSSCIPILSFVSLSPIISNIKRRTEGVELEVTGDVGVTEASNGVATCI